MPPIYGSADRIASQPRVYGPPAPLPQTSPVSGREIVDRHTRGRETDVSAVARDLRQEIRQRPQDATKLMMQALEQVKADDRDEVAQEFIRSHSDAELKMLGQSAAGKGALALAVNELGKGSVHKDEAQDAARVGDALGTKIELEVNTGWARVSGVIHTVLDIAGFIPGLGAIPDLINAGIYAAEGDWQNAAMSGVAAIPGLGDGAKATSMAVKGGRELLEQGVKHGDEVLDAAKLVGKHGDEAADAAKAVTRHGDEAGARLAGESSTAAGASRPASVNGRDQVYVDQAGKKGSWNKELNKDLKPNADYHYNGYRFSTDAQGRVSSVQGKLDLKTAERNGYQQSKAGKAGETGDEGGHLIASIFNGPGERLNLTPMNGNFNKGEWKKLENKLADALKDGKNVQVKIEVQYADKASGRADTFIVTHRIDGGRPVKDVFLNQPGGGK